MKRILILLVFLTGISALQAKTLNAYLSYTLFNNPAGKPFIETYLTVQSQSITFVKTGNGDYTGEVFVEILFKKANDSSIVNFNKYALHLPAEPDTNKFNFNLLDVQRYTLSEGEYFFEMKVGDANSTKKPYLITEHFSIAFPDDKPSFSNIELLSKYTKSEDTSLLVKNGYKLFPYIFNYFPQNVNSLPFYVEFYRPESETSKDNLLLYTYLRPFETDKKLDEYFLYQKTDTRPVRVMLNKFDISKLPSGNYYLVVEARNRDNKVVASQQVFFQRNNPGVQADLSQMLAADASLTFAGKIDNIDTLRQYIKYLYPISSEMENAFAQSVIEGSDLKKMQQYFYSFWLKRDNLHPGQAWWKYKELVDQVNHDFSTLSLKGYLTDRGRVYLQYGPPNVMTKSYNEPAAYPYEIWHYYQLGNQRNKKFVFYSRDLSTNDFQLIHSDAVGELSNYRWQTFIYQRTWAPDDIDLTHPPNAWGNNATDYYYHPR